jgi:hypothetical protein
MKLKILVLTVLVITGCGALPKLSITPVSVDATVGGTHETGSKEDNMAKLEIGTEVSQDKYVAESFQQIENNIQEYPIWLILAFALALGLAVPSPLSFFSSLARNRSQQKQIAKLTALLGVSQPTSTTKPEERS